MPDIWVQKLLSIRRDALIGAAAIVACAAAGWRLGEYRSWPALAVRWWLDRVVGPLVKSRSWLRRAATIALNNSVVCGIVVALGAAGPLAWVGLVGVGFGLGVALRLMAATTTDRASEKPLSSGWSRFLTVVGVLLNLLEIPAIALSAGLGLAQGAWSETLSNGEAFALFGIFVVPLLVVSAAGEATWMAGDSGVGELWSGNRTDRQ